MGADAVHVTCTAEGEYRFAAGKPQEVTSPLDAAMRLAAKVAEMVLFDVPNLHMGAVRVDVYSTFHDATGMPEQQCVLSTVADRATADDVDWDALRPEEIINRFESSYRVNERAIAEAIDPPPLMEDTELVADRAAVPSIVSDDD